MATSSAYANDSTIIKIESSLKTIEKELKTTDLHETSLLPPVLDMEVKFEEK
jgi:hypothetical protein